MRYGCKAHRGHQHACQGMFFLCFLAEVLVGLGLLFSFLSCGHARGLQPPYGASAQLETAVLVTEVAESRAARIIHVGTCGL